MTVLCDTGISGFAGYLVPVFCRNEIGVLEGRWRKIYSPKHQYLTVDLFGHSTYDLVFFPKYSGNASFAIWQQFFREEERDFSLTVNEVPTVILVANPQRKQITITNPTASVITLIVGEVIATINPFSYYWSSASFVKSEVMALSSQLVIGTITGTEVLVN